MYNNIITYCILNPKLTRNKYTFFKQSLFIWCIITSSIIILPNLNNVVIVYGQSEKDIEYQQSYWTESSQSVSTASSSSDQLESSQTRDSNSINKKKIEKEVGPGEGISTLAIELVNTARFDITAVKGFLTLPSGFQSVVNNITNQETNDASTKNITLKNVSWASHNSIVGAGDFFTLFFDVNILNDIDIGGQYNSSLKIIYSKVLEKGKITSIIPIQFEIPGKVILDTVLKGNNKENHLIPGQYSEISLVIKNKGSSYANGVIATIKGFEKQTNESDNLKNDDSNGSDGVGTPSLSSAYPLISAVNTGNRTFNVGTIPPGSSVVIKPLLYIANSAKESVQNLDLQVTYGDSYGNKQTFDSSIGIIVSPLPPASNFNITPMLENVTKNKSNNTNTNNNNNNNTNNNDIVILTAGTIEDLTFKLQNNAKNISNPLTDLVVNLDVSPKESIEILGKSRWIFDYMDPYSYYDLGTKIFASEQIANTPVEFSINIDYILNEELKKESLLVGAYIEGQIKVTGHDFEIRKLGNIPNFSGNLLNEGNSRALFTKVNLEELKPVSDFVVSNKTNTNKDFNISDDNNKKNNYNHNIFLSRPQEQYLGDLDSNSPLPFSIPLDLNTNNTKSKYSFSLSVYYSDNLRKMHHVILNGTVNIINNLSKESQMTNHNSFEINDIISKNYLTFAIFIAVVLIVIIGILYARKKRKKSIPPGFGLETENNNLKRKDDSFFDTSTGLFDEDDDEEKDIKK